MLQREVTVHQISAVLGNAVKILGKKAGYVLTASRIDDANSASITFCTSKNEEGLQLVRSTKAAIVICHEDLSLTAADFKDKTFILVSHPRSAFIRVINKYFLKEKLEFGISSTAFIEKGAAIHRDVYIGHHCYIGKCKIGKGTVLYGNNYVYSNTEIGKNVIIDAGAVIGAEASGFARDAKRELEKFPQMGGVRISDDVQIGSNTSITRGAMESTVIGQGTKIANLCYIGHGAIIGRHCLILNHSAVGGYSRIGDYSRVSLSACIRDGITIGKNVLVGMGAVVTQNVSDNKVVFGVPAKEQGETQQ